MDFVSFIHAYVYNVYRNNLCRSLQQHYAKHRMCIPVDLIIETKKFSNGVSNRFKRSFSTLSVKNVNSFEEIKVFSDLFLCFEFFFDYIFSRFYFLLENVC